MEAGVNGNHGNHVNRSAEIERGFGYDIAITQYRRLAALFALVPPWKHNLVPIDHAKEKTVRNLTLRMKYLRLLIFANI